MILLWNPFWLFLETVGVIAILTWLARRQRVPISLVFAGAQIVIPGLFLFIGPLISRISWANTMPGAFFLLHVVVGLRWIYVAEGYRLWAAYLWIIGLFCTFWLWVLSSIVI